MNWFKSLFNRKDKNEEQPLSVEDEIDNSIQKCRNEIKKAQNEIDQLYKWAADAVHNTFSVPFDLWYYELGRYDEIKNHEINSDVKSLLVKKCDEIIEGYRNQIQMRESKIQLCETLLKEYTEVKQKYVDTKQRLMLDSEEEEKLAKLEKHSDRLAGMDDDTSDIAQSLESSERFKSIENEVHSIEEEFKLREEYHRQLEQLHQEYGTSETHDNPIAYRNEIEKLIVALMKEKK